MGDKRYITVSTNEQLKEFILKYDFDEDNGIELDGAISSSAFSMLGNEKIDFETLNEIGKYHTIKLKEKDGTFDFVYFADFLKSLPNAKKIIIPIEGEILNSETNYLLDKDFKRNVLDEFEKREIIIEGKYRLPLDMDDRNRQMFSLFKFNGEPIVTLEEYKKYKDLLKDCKSFGLFIDNASELPIDDIDKYEFHITSVVMPNFYTPNFQNLELYYDIETYKKCKKVIDDIVGDIDTENLDEATIVYEVMKKLANHMSYDFSACSGTEEQIKNAERTSRNMVGGLLENKCVCVGYSEILRNALACCNIESIRVLSTDKYNNERDIREAHAYNKVKVNDKWYNVDLTADRDNLKENVIPMFFLKSKDEFMQTDKKTFHTDKKIHRNRPEAKCEESYPVSEVYKMVNKDRPKKPINLLKDRKEKEDEGSFLKRSLLKEDNEISDYLSVINCIYEVEKNSYIVAWDRLLGNTTLLGNRRYGFYKRDEKNNTLVKGESLIQEESDVKRKYKNSDKDNSENEGDEIEMYCVSETGKEYALFEKDGEFSLIEVEQKDAKYCTGKPVGKKLYQENPQNFRNTLKKIYKSAKVTLDKIKKIHDQVSPKQRQDEVKKMAAFRKKITQVAKENPNDIEIDW